MVNIEYMSFEVPDDSLSINRIYAGDEVILSQEIDGRGIFLVQLQGSLMLIKDNQFGNKNYLIIGKVKCVSKKHTDNKNR